MQIIRKTLTILILALTCSAVMDAATLTAQQKKDVITKISAKTSSLKTMSCTFTQTKYLSMLSDKMVSQGKMDYKQPNKLRWEYTTPYKYTFILNGAKVYVAGSSRKDVIDTNSNKIFKEIARIMMNTVTGQALASPADFTTDVADGGTLWQVTLVPRKKDMKKMFARIVLSFDKKTLMVTEINIHENNRDRTDIKLKNVKTNTAINENLFAIPK